MSLRECTSTIVEKTNDWTWPSLSPSLSLFLRNPTPRDRLRDSGVPYGKLHVFRLRHDIRQNRRRRIFGGSISLRGTGDHVSA